MPRGESVGLPIRNFLYTPDQIAFLINVREEHVKQFYLHYEGRSVGVCPRDKMIARNIAPEGEKPEWRIIDTSLVRWMRYKGFKVYERGYVKD